MCVNLQAGSGVEDGSFSIFEFHIRSRQVREADGEAPCRQEQALPTGETDREKVMFSVAAQLVWRPGWARAAAALAVSAVASFVWICDASAGDVVVKVVDHRGSPVDGAEVQLEPVSGGRGVKTTESASGRYVLLDVMPGRYRLTCGGSSSRKITVGNSVDQETCQR